MEGNRYIGIVGSRRRNTLHDRKQVFRLVEFLFRKYGDRLVIVSGACPKGADHFAAEAAKAFGVKLKEFPVDKKGITSKWEFAQRAFARNKDIAIGSEDLFCWVHSDRTGGTENTISHMLELKRRIFLVNDSGEVYLSLDGDYPKCEPVVRLQDLSATD